MFRTEIEELFRFQSKEELLRKFNIVRQDRKSVVFYDFGEIKWIVIPDDQDDIHLEDVDLFDVENQAKVMFINKHSFTDTVFEGVCRKLTNNDHYRFSEFHKACPTLDKKNGSVSLSDPIVYGCFVDEKLVSVASLWNWGDKLSDIGVLTHPDYRNKGYGYNVCQMLLKETDKLFIWRCDAENLDSYKLALKLGFEEAGTINVLTKK